MIDCLNGLGFSLNIFPNNQLIEICGYTPTKMSKIHVRNSGITARFILGLCSLIPGEWTINCDKRMTERPNQEIIEVFERHFEISVESMGK